MKSVGRPSRTMTQFTLSAETAPGYLRERGLLDADESGDTVSASSLGGGVSNRVVGVDAPGRSFVLKQPLPNLAVAEDWPADVSRVHNEAAATRAYAAVIEAAGLDDVRVPEILAEDEDAHVVVFSHAPDGAVMWKRELLDGRVDPGVARSLGRLLGTVHARASEDDELRERFADPTPFDQLRVDPYHRTTAERHPGVAEEIRAEAERVLAADRTLVHGDYSPKNVLVDRESERRWLLDFEVAHWGDPAFDTAFMLNHLFIKAVHVEGRFEACVDAARAFWERYREAAGWDVERETVRELAVLMLARVDGKSPVEYLGAGEDDLLREISIRALREGTGTLDGFAEVVGEVAG